MGLFLPYVMINAAARGKHSTRRILVVLAKAALELVAFQCLNPRSKLAVFFSDRVVPESPASNDQIAEPTGGFWDWTLVSE